MVKLNNVNALSMPPKNLKQILFVPLSTFYFLISDKPCEELHLKDSHNYLLHCKILHVLSKVVKQNFPYIDSLPKPFPIQIHHSENDKKCIIIIISIGIPKTIHSILKKKKKITLSSIVAHLKSGKNASSKSLKNNSWVSIP